MPKHSYKFNPESLSYTKVRRSIVKTFLRFGSYFLASLMLAVIYYIVLSPIYSNYEERQIRRQNKLLSSYFDTLVMKYELFEGAFEGIRERDTGIYRSVFYANPVSPFATSDDYTNNDRISLLGNYDNISLTNKASQQLSRLDSLANTNSKRLETILQTLTDSSKMAKSLPAIQPVENISLTRVGASVGTKVHPFYKILRMHNGIDFTVPIDTEVFATGDGVVTSIENRERGEGVMVTISHGFGYTTTYAHLNKVLVSKGAKVKRGQTIALSGDSGTSIWPHLHYEVRKDGKVRNPVSYFFADLSPQDLDIVVNLSSNTGQSLD